MKILVLNCGSSSVKYQLINMVNEEVIASGLVERIGGEESIFSYKPGNKDKIKYVKEGMDHAKAMNEIISMLTSKENGVISSIKEIDAVGHRVVHGGEYFIKSVIINDEVIKKIEECIELAPLHNPANLKGIKIMMDLLPGVKNVAVFDTAFHQTMPDYAYIYPLPYRFYKDFKIRRYGFHGTSHRYVSIKAAEYLNKKIDKCNLITCHLGNGASITAIKNGVSVDTSMGFTPLEGLMMGTRTGDIDPAIVLFLIDKFGMTTTQVNNILNKESGLLGISGISNDMRLIIEERDKNKNKLAALSLDIYVYKVKKYIGAYIAALGEVDALIFTAGVGENDSEIRERVCENMENFGIKLDLKKNVELNRKEGIISTSDSKVKVIIIPTNEELMIAKDTYELIKEKGK
ncbi:MAG: acetate kinase [Spirochaetes bacterium]|nr:acetate kinase [Spirochaetota bacterium]